MSRLSNFMNVFFRKDSVQFVLNLGKQILKMFIGRLAEDLQRIAWDEVKKAQLAGGTGSQKAKAAFEGIKRRMPEVRDSQINLALEIAVSALKTSSI